MTKSLFRLRVRTCRALIVVAMLALASCSSPVDRVLGPGASRGADGATAGPLASGSANASPGASRLPDDRRPDCHAPIQRFAQASETRSYISVYLDETRNYGPLCPAVAPGRDCSIPLAGAWRLVESNSGSMLVEIFENGSKEAARKALFKPIPQSGRLNRTMAVRYTPTARATVLDFHTKLYDRTGREVARTPPQTLPLPACDPTLSRG